MQRPPAHFYDSYCNGYSFLDNLGLGYGLAIEVPSQADSWNKLTSEQQENLLTSFYPNIENEIQKVIDWLNNNKVILTGTQDEYNHYEYIDNRTEEEKLSTAYKVKTVNTTTETDQIQKGTKDIAGQKSWWKFW